MTTSVEIFDAALVHERQRRAAGSIGEHNFLLLRVADDFAERLSIIQRTFPLAACFGTHQSPLADRLRESGQVGDVVELGRDGWSGDPQDHVTTETALPPLAGQSLDLIVSGLTLQLVNDLPGALIQMRRALKPDGLLLVSLLGGETLKELREAWLIAEEEVSGGASPRVAPFADVQTLGGLLQRAGFALPVVDSDTIRVTYPSALDLMRDVKGMGASNALMARRRLPVSRRLLFRAVEVYAERFSDPDGRIRATFEIITLTAWAPHESQQQPLKPGTANARLADVLGTREHRTGDEVSVPQAKNRSEETR